MPFRPKERDPDVDKAIERVVELHQQIDRARSGRAEAVRAALAKGASLRELAERLGMSQEGVRKIRDSGVT